MYKLGHLSTESLKRQDYISFVSSRQSDLTVESWKFYSQNTQYEYFGFRTVYEELQTRVNDSMLKKP